MAEKEKKYSRMENRAENMSGMRDAILSEASQSKILHAGLLQVCEPPWRKDIWRGSDYL